MAVLTCGTAYKPVVGTFSLARGHNVLSRFGLEIAAFIPIHGHILDELESVEMTVIHLRHVGSHLERAVHCHIQRELTGDCTVDMSVSFGIHFLHVHIENAGSIVHRTALQAGKG